MGRRELVRRVHLVLVEMDRHGRVVEKVAVLRQQHDGPTYGMTFGGGGGMATTTAAQTLDRSRARVQLAERNLINYQRQLAELDTKREGED